MLVETGEPEYVQFMIRPDRGIWGEVIGDRNRSTAYDADERRLLTVLGWNDPKPAGEHAGNHWREWPAWSELEAATVAVLTCLDVFRAGPRTPVRVKVFEAVGKP